jgi:Asp-tRNA(Asn)/Glu-tRNA(Gln) amidotransferase B subunit
LKEVRKLKISKELLEYVTDADLSTKLEGVEYSTNLREIVTVGYMMEHHLEGGE